MPNLYHFGKVLPVTLKMGLPKPTSRSQVKTFQTGKVPVPAEETIELFAFMEAADESKRLEGKPVKIADIIARAWPQGGMQGYKKVQPIGPSPVVIHKDDLKRIAKEWESTAVALKTNSRANNALGW